MLSLIDYLRKIQPLSPEATAAFERVCSALKIKKGKDLQSIGQTCRTIYFLERGCARIYYYKDGI